MAIIRQISFLGVEKSIYVDIWMSLHIASIGAKDMLTVYFLPGRVDVGSGLLGVLVAVSSSCRRPLGTIYVTNNNVGSGTRVTPGIGLKS